MKKIISLIKESFPECIKENIKLISVWFFSGLGVILLNFIKNLNAIELKIKLTIIISFIIVFLVLIISIVIIFKKYYILKKELLNPPNENVNKFHNGDIVILKLEKDSNNPHKISVNRTTKSEVLCRDNSGELKSYAPEELLTEAETELILEKINSATSVRKLNRKTISKGLSRSNF